ncbi:hypothetical protein [Nonomuraea jabiensis]|uniref:hypothetical protein n=1 Tax=Nonomuraea jabiensis TaxID=882448 RepID=UPI003D76168C
MAESEVGHQLGYTGLAYGLFTKLTGRTRDAQVSEKERDDPDDFGGISFGRMAFILVVMALGHPWETLKELFRLIRRLGRRVLRLVLVPFRLAMLVVWSRTADRRPTFEDHLHGDDEDRAPS